MAATAEGDTERVRKLLDDGAEVDERYPNVGGFNDSHTPLLVASRDGHAEIVRLLLAAGADVNAVEPTFGAVPLHKAVYNGHAEITADLVRQDGIDLNWVGATNGYTPLHDSLWHGYEECSRILVEAGADLTHVAHDGKSPLDLAVEVFGEGHALTELIRARSAG
jgi:ankyrin repeat protein